MPPVTIFQGRFTLDKLLGKGGFGEVYAGTQVATGDRVAVKLEPNTGRSFLFHEARVMQDLQTYVPVPGAPPPAGLPTLRYFGQEGDYRILIMTLHGPSLEDLHEHLGRFSLKTTAMLADQMVSRLEFVHAAGYIHRDLKPDNFLMGTGRVAHHVYLIDFGLSCKYLVTPSASTATHNGSSTANAAGSTHSVAGAGSTTSMPGGASSTASSVARLVHREMQTGKHFVGTTRYASLRTHQGVSQSRRDDLEQLAYILVYLYRGRLPWSGLNIKDRDEKERAIGDMKEKLPTSQICGRCPRQFEDLLLYARKMEFDEAPQYEMVRMLMASVLEDMGPVAGRHDFDFDWIAKKREQQQAAAAAAAAAQATSGAAPAGGVEGAKSPPLSPRANEGAPVSPLAAAGSGLRAVRGVASPKSPVNSGGPEVFSSAAARGVFSGFGSGMGSQDITSLHNE